MAGPAVVWDVVGATAAGDPSSVPHAGVARTAAAKPSRPNRKTGRNIPPGSLPVMAHSSDARLLVLHTVRVKGIADDDAIIGATGLDPKEVRATLGDLAEAGAATHRDGRITGWSLTPEGRAQHAKIVADELDAAGGRDEVTSAYRDFLSVNAALLGVCTDWQLKSGNGAGQQLNQHDDPAYDAAVIARLREVDDTVQPVCARLAAVLERFTSYGPRLSRAVARVESGEVEWFTKPLIDSYHTVWFELHEDLLATLGIERSKEEL